MRKYLMENKILLIVLICGFIASGIAIGGRISTETANKTYDVVLDYSEFEKLSGQTESDIEWWLGQFNDMGITKVGLSEESLETMSNDPECPVEADVVESISKSADWKSDYPDAFIAAVEERHLDKYDVLGKALSPETFSFISNSLTKRFDSDKYLIFPVADEAGTAVGGYIWMDGTVGESLYGETYKKFTTENKGFIEATDMLSSKLMYQSLGLDEDKVALIQNNGMEVIPRTFSYDGWNDSKYAKAVFEEYDELNVDPSYMIVAGSGVIGNDDGTDAVVDYLDRTGSSIALIEMTDQLQNIEQDGVEDVVRETSYNTIRVYSVWNYIQYRYGYYGYEGAEEIENTLFRAVTERNIRVIYYKPIKETDDTQIYITDIDIYKNMFANLAERLAEHGFEMGRASVMNAYTTSALMKIIMGFGAVAACILMLGGFLTISRKVKYGLLVLGVIGVAGAFFVLPNMSKLILSLGSATVFACLATILVVMQAKHDWDKLDKNAHLMQIIPRAALTLTAGVAVALVGGIMTAGPISEIDFMLELSVFRGVKAAQILPLAFFVLAFLAYFGFTERKKKPGRLEGHDLLSLANTDLKVWMVVAGVALLAGGYYYITRTGHTSNFVPSTPEMLMRNTLEQWLIARPRSKEFLFAFPSLMMFIYVSVRKWKLWSALFGLCSVIGLTSVINTFMHIRTPLYLGFFRTGFSFIFGLVIGAVGIVIFEALYKLCLRVISHYGGSIGEADENV